MVHRGRANRGPSFHDLQISLCYLCILLWYDSCASLAWFGVILHHFTMPSKPERDVTGSSFEHVSYPLDSKTLFYARVRRDIAHENIMSRHHRTMPNPCHKCGHIIFLFDHPIDPSKKISRIAPSKQNRSVQKVPPDNISSTPKAPS